MVHSGESSAVPERSILMEHGLNVGVLAVVAGCFILWGLLSARLERWNVSAPMAFVVLGVASAHGRIELVHFQLTSTDIRSLAEVTLALVLFSDASRVNARRLRGDVGLPLRLLTIGLPLTIGAGTAIAFGLFGGSGIWVAASIAANLAPPTPPSEPRSSRTSGSHREYGAC